MVLTSDHGESLGEHDYFFDHGEDLFDPSPGHPARARRTRGQGRPSERALRLHPRPRAHRARRGQGLVPARPRRGEPLAGGPGDGTARPRAALRPERPEPRRDLRPPVQDRGDAGGRQDAVHPLSTGPRIRTRRATSRPRSRRSYGPHAGSWSCCVERIDQEWARTRRLLEGQSGRREAQRRGLREAEGARLRPAGVQVGGRSVTAPTRRTPMARSFAGAGVALVTPFTKDGVARRGRAAAPRQAPGRRRHRRARPLRHHRGERHPRRGRADGGSSRSPSRRRDASRCSRARAATTRERRSRSRRRRPTSAPTASCPSGRTTTSRHPRASTATSRPSPTRARCPVSSTTCPAAPAATSTRRRSFAWPPTANIHGGQGGLGEPRADHGDPARPARGLRGPLRGRRLHAGGDGPRRRRASSRWPPTRSRVRCTISWPRAPAGDFAEGAADPQPAPPPHEPELRGSRTRSR